jgi:hypothetical protein
MTLVANIRPVPVSAIMVPLHKLLVYIQYDFRYIMHINLDASTQLCGKSAKRKRLESARGDGGWLGSSYESDNAHSAGKESGCQMKSGAAGDGSLLSTPG